jgi:hypothetical protein
MSSNESRIFLINAEEIMRKPDAAERNNNCGSCFGLNESGTMPGTGDADLQQAYL